jgi:hypothetical protein
VTTARDTLAKLLETRWGTTENWAAKLIEQMADAGFVVVACPPGSRVVVSRESKPCEPCGGAGQWYHQDTYDAVSCESCGGSGVVEATTTYGREQLLGLIEDFVDRDDCRFDHHGYCQAHAWFETDPACPHARAKSILAAVALPEEGE